MDAIFTWIPLYGYPALFVLLMLGLVGLPIPDETLLAFSGYLIFTNQLAPMPTLVTAFLGSICGITISYLTGRCLGVYFVDTVGRRLGIGPDDMDKVNAWYVRWGKYALFVGYFVPGVRHLVAIVAGSSHLPLAIFMPFAYTGALIRAVTFVGLGYGLGETWALASATVQQGFAVAGAIALVVLIGLFVVRKEAYPSRDVGMHSVTSHAGHANLSVKPIREHEHTLSTIHEGRGPHDLPIYSTSPSGSTLVPRHADHDAHRAGFSPEP
jgi:membrane protein DedA with SNARE-associated domain